MHTIIGRRRAGHAGDGARRRHPLRRVRRRPAAPHPLCRRQSAAAGRIAAIPSSGASPLTVSFSAAGSSDPEGQTLTYAWDLDGDGSFDDGTGLTRSWTYTGAAATTITARVLVSDTGGQSAVAAAPILLNGTRPTAVIDTPTGSLQWKVGDPIGFSGRGVDPDEPGGQLPASALQWEVIIHHCPSDCHVHSMQTFNGVASGSFNAPDHEYPSSLELRLTVTDPTGASDLATVTLQPQTTSLTFNTNVAAPLTLAVNGAASVTPFSRTVIVGSSNSLNAQSPQTIGGTTYTFNSWSDGLPQLHQITAPATPTTYTASYGAGQATSQTVTFQVAAGSDDANQQAAAITTDAATVFLGNADASQVNTTGFRFTGVTIPPGAVVTAASLEVTPSATQWSAMSFEVGAEAAVNSATFSAASGPSSRPLLAPRATHFSNEQWLANTWFSASDELGAVGPGRRVPTGLGRRQRVVAHPSWHRRRLGAQMGLGLRERRGAGGAPGRHLLGAAKDDRHRVAGRPYPGWATTAWTNGASSSLAEYGVLVQPLCVREVGGARRQQWP